MKIRLNRAAGLIAASILTLTVAGCSGDAAEPAAQAPGTQDREAAAVAASGCEDGEATDTEELYVRALYTCDAFDLYIYDDKTARDSWSKAAAEFGTVELKRGETWIAVKT